MPLCLLILVLGPPASGQDWPQAMGPPIHSSPKRPQAPMKEWEPVREPHPALPGGRGGQCGRPSQGQVLLRALGFQRVSD